MNIMLSIAMITGIAAWFFISSSINDIRNDY